MLHMRLTVSINRKLHPIGIKIKNGILRESTAPRQLVTVLDSFGCPRRDPRGLHVRMLLNDADFDFDLGLTST